MVSIIVPVYRSEKTLKRCVDSLLEQDYPDIEILLIVDGPPDGSGILAESLAKNDNRIRVLNQENQGVSKARNRGIQEAKGKYIRFVDSDDYVGKHSISPMVEAMEHDQSDLVIAGFDHIYFGKTIEKLPSKNGILRLDKSCTSIDWMKNLYKTGFLNMPWNKLYKKELIKNGFPLNINLGEDLIFNQNYISSIRSISVLQSIVCEYIQDDRGTTLSTKKRDDKIETALLLYNESKQFFSNLSDTKKIDTSFLETKVISTFLDDIEGIGFEKISRAKKSELIRVYANQADQFLKQTHSSHIELTLLDYKIIYFFLKRKWIGMTGFMISLRTLVVKMVRKGKRA